MFKIITEPIVFCDVETTGISAKTNRITEIACLRYENGVEVDRLVTLVNPEMPIPWNVQNITGITPAMVVNSPTFAEISEAVIKIFDSAIMVAHNARFDYSFIKTELQQVGHDFKNRQLCTVDLSRRLYPELRSHSLSSLIKHFGFECHARHRALGDTEVLIQFANYLDQTKSIDELGTALKNGKTAVSLPPNLKPKTLDTLPPQPGVYSFIGQHGEVIYIGKSINIKKRVKSHFSNALHDSKSRNIYNEIHDIITETTASDLGAQLLELHKIKTELPIFNRRSRRLKKLWYLKKSHNDQNYSTINLESTTSLQPNDLESVYGIFRSKQKAKDFLDEAAKEHKFCPYLLGTESGTGQCFRNQLDLCSGACVGTVSPQKYNKQFESFFATRKLRTWPYQGSKELVFNNTEVGKTERFVINNWILETAEVYEFDEPYNLFPTNQPVFDYEMYKVLVKYI